MYRSVTLVLCLIYLLVVGGIAYVQVVERVKSQAEQKIQTVASRLEIQLDKYRTLPRVLVLHPAIRRVLAQPNEANVTEVNQLLNTYNKSLSSDAVYLMSHQGVTLSSSNWQQQDSFVNSNYGFRPYFQQAIKGEEGSYFALGTVSGKRGYYFSFPVRHDDTITGVLVVKVALSVIEQYNAEDDAPFMVTDDHGAVFYSSYANWNYTSLVDLPEAVRAEIKRQQQYGEGTLKQLTPLSQLSDVLHAETLSLTYEGQPRTYLLAEKTLPQVGWHLIVLTPIIKVYGLVTGILVGALVLFVLVALLSMIWRRNNIAQRQLAAVNEQLEHRVEQRTAQLQATNNTLLDTIDMQKQTEQRLKETQNELIQAGKLALLGEMSASINHELNQPLTALLTYSETLKLMISRNKTEGIESTSDEIIKLVQKMATMVAQYKLFARKSAGKIGPVLVSDTIAASLSILEGKISKMNANISVSYSHQGLTVMAEAVPLEQVLVNLLNNALQSQENVPQAKVEVNVYAHDEKVVIEVKDWGSGFSQEQLSVLFEPFYTTKSKGLGLGLTISQRIMASFGGTISAANHPEGGAVFTLTLPMIKSL
ncbi:sensor histidine kinase [Alteromonas sp. D210916BOD_24]|uniref:sensor histidine kinase n=1 Tax=Alteromonas sp. D210916BOD_24 TaxID=3157618 RepID=UPI00399CB912